MTTRDELIRVLMGTHLGTRTADYHANDRYIAEVADRILALLPPREPTPAMVEAMARRMCEAIMGTEADGELAWERRSDQNEWRLAARAAWAAGYVKGEER